MTPPSAERAVHANHETAMTAARTLLPALRSRAAQAETDRTICKQTVNEIREAGLFHLCAPRAFGGSQLGISTFVDVTAEIASACGSTGWVYAVLAGHNWTLSLLPLEAQQEVFDDQHALVASVIHLSSERVTRVEGGYQIDNAVGRFCSGIDHARWILVGSEVVCDDQRREPHYFLVPGSDFEIQDDWYAVGLRGTGSKSVSAAKLFVPEHRSCSLARAADGMAPGTIHHAASLYRLPFRETQRLHLLGVPLGLARAAIAHYTNICRDYHLQHGIDSREQSHKMLLRLAGASVEYDAASSLVSNDAQMLDSQSDAARLSAFDRARCLRDIAYTAQQCRHIVSRLFETSGARGLLDENILQRIWRDANAAAAHVAFVRDDVDPGYARAICGIEE